MKHLAKMPPAKRIFLMSLDELVKTRSIDKVRTREIYEYAGLSANTFYYHFKDKYDCASLLFQYYETRLHVKYSGNVEDFYEYISSGNYIRDSIEDTDKADTSSGLEMLRLCYEEEFKMTRSAYDFWQKHQYIFTHVLNSDAQNSPRVELYEAWNKSFYRILDLVPSLDSLSKKYMSHMFCECFFTFWFSCIGITDHVEQDLESCSNLFRETFFALYNVVESASQNDCTSA